MEVVGVGEGGGEGSGVKRRGVSRVGCALAGKGSGRMLRDGEGGEGRVTRGIGGGGGGGGYRDFPCI